jgi:DNA invertase Pin-like site-specific DNA recombinase
MKYGYVRVLTDDQSTALKRAGCKLLFKDEGLSGAVMCAAYAADERGTRHPQRGCCKYTD